jgi:hypothetical protein
MYEGYTTGVTGGELRNEEMLNSLAFLHDVIFNFQTLTRSCSDKGYFGFGL